MNKLMDHLVEEIEGLQAFLDYRTIQVNLAISYMSNMQYEEAKQVLDRLEAVTFEEFLSWGDLEDDE